jgi:hypothetical protein
LVSIASAQLTGQDHLVSLDRRRADVAGQQPEPVPTPASTTAAGVAKRFTGQHLRGIEEAIEVVNIEWVSRLPVTRRGALPRAATIDGDTTDVEVYGHTKQDAAHAYTGALNLRVSTSGSGSRPAFRTHGRRRKDAPVKSPLVHRSGSEPGSWSAVSCCRCETLQVG